jgi:hypothetical protein
VQWTVTYRDGHATVDMIVASRELAIEAACALMAKGTRVVSIDGNDEFMAENDIRRVCAGRRQGSC